GAAQEAGGAGGAGGQEQAGQQGGVTGEGAHGDLLGCSQRDGPTRLQEVCQADEAAVLDGSSGPRGGDASKIRDREGWTRQEADGEALAALLDVAALSRRLALLAGEEVGHRVRPVDAALDGLVDALAGGVVGDASALADVDGAGAGDVLHPGGVGDGVAAQL